MRVELERHQKLVGEVDVTPVQQRVARLEDELEQLRQCALTFKPLGKACQPLGRLCLITRAAAHTSLGSQKLMVTCLADVQLLLKPA